MIRELLVRINRRSAGGGRHVFGGQMIVDAPADVLGTRLTALAPPGVLLGSGVDKTEDVAPTVLLEQIRQPLAFLGEESPSS